jgi:hypothetical protein
MATLRVSVFSLMLLLMVVYARYVYYVSPLHLLSCGKPVHRFMGCRNSGEETAAGTRPLGKVP